MDNEIILNQVYGHIEILNWFEYEDGEKVNSFDLHEGKDMYGMSRIRKFDNGGELLWDKTERTPIRLYWSVKKESLWCRILKFIRGEK